MAFAALSQVRLFHPHQRAMNLPNKLTVARFGLTLVFVGLASVPESHPHHLQWWRLGYILGTIAGVTDFFDGYLARKYNLITKFGQLMDPLVDKIFTISAFIVFTERDIVPGWVTILILAREFAVTGLRVMAGEQGFIIPAAPIGKYKTALQMICLLLGGCFWVQWLPYVHGGALFWIWQGIIYAIALFTVYTGIDYFYQGRKLYLNET